VRFIWTIVAVTEAEAALGYAVFSTAMIVMRLLGDSCVTRWGVTTIARVSGVVATAGALCVVTASTLMVCLIGFALMGLGYALVMPMAFSRAANDRVSAPGTAIAGVATFGYGGMLLGPPLMGFVADASSLTYSFLLLAVIATLIVVFAHKLTHSQET